MNFGQIGRGQLRHGLQPVMQPAAPRQDRRQVDQATHDREHGQHQQRPGHHPWRLVQMLLLLLAAAIGAMEGVDHEPRHVERREQGGNDAHRPQHVEGRGLVAARERCGQDLILREEPRETRDTGNGQRGDPHERRRERHPLPQPTHVPHVLGFFAAVGVVIRVVQSVDHATRAEKEERLEEGVRSEMEDAGRVGADTHAHEHVAELGHR